MIRLRKFTKIDNEVIRDKDTEKLNDALVGLRDGMVKDLAEQYGGEITFEGNGEKMCALSNGEKIGEVVFQFWDQDGDNIVSNKVTITYTFYPNRLTFDPDLSVHFQGGNLEKPYLVRNA